GGGPGAVVDPALEEGDFLGGETPSLGRHGDGVVGAGDGVDQPAGAALAGDDGGPGVAALECALRGVEAQAGALLLGAVAGGAVLRQDRLDVARVIDGIGGPGAGEKNEGGQHGGGASHGRSRRVGGSGGGRALLALRYRVG